MNRLALIRLVSGCILSLPAAFPAFAQDAEDQDTGVPRLPEYIGRKHAAADTSSRVVFGGSAGLMYHDNVFRSKNDKKDDFVAVVAPGLSLRSVDDRHEARAKLRIEGGKYMDHDENDYVDMDARGHGEYRLSHVVSLLGNARLARDHVEIGSFADNPDRTAAEPTVYRRADVGVGVEADDGRYYGLLDTAITYFDYDDAEARGGALIINDDRDRNEWKNRLRIGFYPMPEILTYVQGSANRRSYREDVDATAIFPKDSDGYGFALGVASGDRKTDNWFDLSGGYLAQNYDDPFLPDVDTLGLEGEGEWRLSEALRLQGRASRGVEENTLFGASGHIMTRVRAGFEYQVAPRWTVGSHARFTENDFQINPASGLPGRRDDVFDVSALVEYNIIGDYFGGVEYMYVDRNSTDSTVEYSTNAVLARFSLKY